MSYKGFLSHSIVSKEDQGFHDLKNKAAEHYRSTGVPQKIETVLNEMFWQKPDDIYGYLMVCSAVMDGPCDGLADGVAESGEVFFNSNQHNQQRLSITTALKWIREHLNPMLQGFNPTDQTNLDKVLRDFFMARYLEYKDSLNREEEDELKNESVSEALTPAPAKEKKGGDKGKKGNSTEKPLPPAETPVPRLPGATAVGVVSLAVPRTAARLLGEALY